MTKETSTAERPDLDWSQVKETVRMINLAVAQIDMAMRESDDSINALTGSFTAMVDHVSAISQTAAQISGEENAGAIESIQHNCQDVTDNMQHSIIAFQFYDKLSQRLDHVNHSMTSLAELVADQSRLYNPAEWVGLQNQIRSRYSMKEEQDMFDVLLGGASIEEALDACRDKVNHMTSSAEDIELF